MAKKRIMIVEDEPIIAYELQETLESEGYAVCPLIDKAEDVLRAFVTEKPDIIIMDIHLKGFIDGIDAVQRLRLLNGNTPIVYITAYSTEASRQKARKTHPAAYMTKPIQNKLLLSVLNNCLYSRPAS